MPRIEKGFGERSTDDIVRDILREYSNRENPISAKNIEGIAKRKGVEIGRNAVKGFANRIGARSYETEEECDAIIEECQEIEREIVFEKKGPSGRTIGYWMMETISESEWMFLLDSVLNSKILTNKGAKNLAKRITFLAGKNFSELTKYRHRMENQPYFVGDDEIKAGCYIESRVLKQVHLIREAIKQGKIVNLHHKEERRSGYGRRKREGLYRFYGMAERKKKEHQDHVRDNRIFKVTRNLLGNGSYGRNSENNHGF